MDCITLLFYGVSDREEQLLFKLLVGRAHKVWCSLLGAIVLEPYKDVGKVRIPGIIPVTGVPADHTIYLDTSILTSMAQAQRDSRLRQRNPTQPRNARDTAKMAMFPSRVPPRQWRLSVSMLDAGAGIRYKNPLTMVATSGIIRRTYFE